MALIVQTCGVVGTLIAATIAVRSYVNSNKRAEEARKREIETRQAQLFMGLYQSYYSKDFMEAEYGMRKIELKKAEDSLKMWENFDGYSAWSTLVTYYEGIGVLVREGLIDIGLVSKLMSGGIVSYWEKNRAGFIDFRERFNWPRACIEVEYLYNRVIEYGREHPELDIKSPSV
jgi:hypothetical protein